MINRRIFIKSSTMSLFSRSCNTPLLKHDCPNCKRPNLLFIFTDDQRWDAIGYMNSHIHTPNLDKLSSQGIQFTEAFITLPVCSPARATAATGRYCMANGVTDYFKPMKASEKSFASYLNQAGYITALIGKWHIPGRSPKDLEFQQVHQLGNGATYMNPKVFDNGTTRKYRGYSTDYCVERTIDLMTHCQQVDTPFGIWLCPQAPHDRGAKKGGNWYSEKTKVRYKDGLSLFVPPSIDDDLNGKPTYLKHYRGRRLMMSKGPMTPERYRDQTDYYAQITEMDRSLGQLFEVLKQKNLCANTYIIFMSDNGLFRGEHGLMSKALHYEESIRVPLFVVGPGIKKGRDERSLVTNADIAATLLDLAGIQIPQNMHGVSLKSTLLTHKPLERYAILFELPTSISNLETRPAYTIRTHRWKYIQTFENGKDNPYTFEELYDLKEDPYEMENMINGGEYTHIAEKLRHEIEIMKKRYAK